MRFEVRDVETCKALMQDGWTLEIDWHGPRTLIKGSDRKRVLATAVPDVGRRLGEYTYYRNDEARKTYWSAAPRVRVARE